VTDRASQWQGKPADFSALLERLRPVIGDKRLSWGAKLFWLILFVFHLGGRSGKLSLYLSEVPGLAGVAHATVWRWVKGDKSRRGGGLESMGLVHLIARDPNGVWHLDFADPAEVYGQPRLVRGDPQLELPLSDPSTHCQQSVDEGPGPSTLCLQSVETHPPEAPAEDAGGRIDIEAHPLRGTGGFDRTIEKLGGPPAPEGIASTEPPSAPAHARSNEESVCASPSPQRIKESKKSASNNLSTCASGLRPIGPAVGEALRRADNPESLRTQKRYWEKQIREAFPGVADWTAGKGADLVVYCDLPDSELRRVMKEGEEERRKPNGLANPGGFFNHKMQALCKQYGYQWCKKPKQEGEGDRDSQR